jgi:hypothetical protein
MLLGFQDPWVWLAYTLSILSALLCVAWGIRNWNRGENGEEQPDKVKHWAAEEDKVEQEL